MKFFNSTLSTLFVASILIFTILIKNANSYNRNLEPYLSPEKIFPQLIDSPALLGSKKYKKEVKYILKLQKNADLLEVDEAFKERHLRPEMILQNIFPNLSRPKYPKLYKLLDKVHTSAGYVSYNTKNYWGLKRPYVAIKKVRPLIAAHSNPAYPSGHTTVSYSLARILTLIFPDKKQDFLDRANVIANHRVLVGMHFPQDLKGGRQLSLLIVGAILQSEDFSRDLAAAKKELKDIINKKLSKN